MVPGRVAPWNGQALLPEIARALVDGGVRGFVFVLVGEDDDARQIRARRSQARTGAWMSTTCSG